MATVHSAVARTLARAIDSYGYSSEEIFNKNGIQMEDVKSRDVRIPNIPLQGVWHDAVEITGDDALGITFAELFRLGSLHGFGFTWAASNNLLDAFYRLVRYFRVISSIGEIVINAENHSEGADVELWFKLPMPGNLAVSASLDAALALFLQLCRHAKETPFKPKSVEFQRSRPQNIERFESFFSCPLSFNCPEYKIIFKRYDLEQELIIANPELARANDQIVEDYLKRFDLNNMASQVSAQIIEALPSGQPTQSDIADRMHMSTRTMQRKLLLEGTSFSELIDNARLTLAQRYLSQPWRSIGEISYLLGYTEPSNFTRSFKRSTNQTPQEYRETVKDSSSKEE